MGWAALQGAARRIALWHQQYDVWLTTVLSRPPARIGEFDVGVQDWAKGYEPFVGYAPFTALQNATGQPAISVPLHWTFDNLPIGYNSSGALVTSSFYCNSRPSLNKRDPGVSI